MLLKLLLQYDLGNFYCIIDNKVIATPTLADHIDRIDAIFDCTKTPDMKNKPSNCENFMDSIKYLVRMLDKYELKLDPDTVEAELTWKTNKTDRQALSHKGIVFYWCFQKTYFLPVLSSQSYLLEGENKI